jgi:hypothetical protein
MQKKRVRVYKPGGEVMAMMQGLPTLAMGGNPMSPQVGDQQGMDIESILTSYGQMKGMSQEQLQQTYQQIMQMPQDQQQQVIQNMVAELNQTAAPQMRDGGLAAAKKLLKKKIGGVNPNSTSESVLDNRKEDVKNAIGASVARNLVDKAYEEASMQQANMQDQMGMYDRGGYTGGMNPYYNPYIDEYNQSAQTARNSFKNFGSSLFDLGKGMRYTGTKVKTKGVGDFINRPASIATDYDLNAMPDYLQLEQVQMYNPDVKAFANGGLKQYDPGGVTDAMRQAAIEAGDGQLWDKNNDGKLDDEFKQATTPAAPAAGPAPAPASPSPGFTGMYQGIVYQNGVPVSTVGNNMNPFGAYPGVGPMDLNQNFGLYTAGDMFRYLSSPGGAEAFGRAAKAFQPEDVYLSKIKGKSGPFGNKFVAKWEYGPDGTPRPKMDANEVDDKSSATGNRLKDRLGNLNWERRADRFSRRQDRRFPDESAVEKTGYAESDYGIPSESEYTSTEDDFATWGVPKDAAPAPMSKRELRRADRSERRAMRESFKSYEPNATQPTTPTAPVVNAAPSYGLPLEYPVPGGTGRVTTAGPPQYADDGSGMEIPNSSTQTINPMDYMSGSLSLSGQPIQRPTAANMDVQGGTSMFDLERAGEPASLQYAPEQSVYPYMQRYPGYAYGGSTLSRFAPGGSAGKLVIKDQYSAPGYLMANGLLAGMNMAADLNNQSMLDERQFMPHTTMPVLEDSRSRNPLQRGTWGTSTLTGEEIPDIQPFNEAPRWSVGSGNFISGQNPYAYGQNGGELSLLFQEGGTYELDDNEIQDLINSGAEIQYFQ